MYHNVLKIHQSWGNVGFRAWTATTTATATGASHVVDGRGRLREGYARLQRNLREKEKCRRQLQHAGPQELFPENSSQGIGSSQSSRKVQIMAIALLIAYDPPGSPGHAAAAIGVEKGLSEGFSG